MNIEILSSKNTIISEMAHMALKHRLYVSGWCLSDELKDAREWPSAYDIRLALLDNVPVGVAVLRKDSRELQVFVRKKLRRHGIGQKMVRSFVLDTPPKTGCGIIGSLEFWESCFP